MKHMRFDNQLHPGITMHKIPVQAGFAGLVFTIGMLAVFLMGVPALIYFLLLAIALGIGVAVMLRFIPRQAAFVVLVLAGVMIVWLAGIPRMDWPEELDRNLLQSATLAPPPSQESELSVYRCDCHERKLKEPCDSATRRDQKRRKRPQPQSAGSVDLISRLRPASPKPLDGIWRAR